MSETTVQVITNNGPVIGRKRAELGFYSFHQIPYGKPPVGERRFKDPQPIDNWQKPHDGTAEGNFPMAMAFFGKISENTSEDCLRLNVHTKQLQSEHLKPVMIWFYGGGFVMGSTAESFYGPEFLMQKDIVLVTINYRVGAFGFLSIADEEFEIPGNAGLKDQTLAMRWVAANCSHFGGDPNNITVFGTSAGGASVHNHLISPHSKGLFHKAIMQSGSAFNAWAHRPNDSELNERLARKLGWNGEGGTRELVNVLRNADAATITIEQEVKNVIDRQNGRISTFTPTIEPYDNGNCFVGADYLQSYKSAWGNQVPLIIGGMSDEGYLFFSSYTEDKTMFEDDAYFTNAIPWEANLPEDSPERRAIAAKLKAFYYGDQTPSHENIDTYAQLLGDKQFWHGIVASARARVQDKSAAQTYLYRFSFNSEVLQFFKQTMCPGRQVKGAVHAEDIQYLFKVTGANEKITVNSAEDKIMNLLIDVWTTFAATGNPNCSAIKNSPWTPLINNGMPFKCLNIDEQSQVIDLPETKRIAMWDSMFAF